MGSRALLAVVVTLGLSISACAVPESGDGSGIVIGGYGDDDSDVAEAVRTALGGRAETARHDIDVTHENGVVRLYGFVNTDGEKAAAERVARGVDGVRSVHNSLIVR